MYKSVCDSRVALGTYNSTTILELLAANTPIVLYWNPIHSEIRKSEEAIFEGLIQANVLHQDPKNAADFINNNWENINEWWNSNKVQTVVKNFCNVYAKTSKKALKDWKQSLKYVANK
jgi:putative transferase (TIGR04331 family)